MRRWSGRRLQRAPPVRFDIAALLAGRKIAPSDADQRKRVLIDLLKSSP